MNTEASPETAFNYVRSLSRTPVRKNGEQGFHRIFVSLSPMHGDVQFDWLVFNHRVGQKRRKKKQTEGEMTL